MRGSGTRIAMRSTISESKKGMIKIVENRPDRNSTVWNRVVLDFGAAVLVKYTRLRAGGR